MFKYKKCKITFRKRMQDYNLGRWKEVTDAHLMGCLSKLHEKYDFKIISVDFNDCFRGSHIVLKCKKEHEIIIFSEFMAMTSGQIENAKIH